MIDSTSLKTGFVKPGRRRVVRELRRFLVAGSLCFLLDFVTLVTLRELFGVAVLVANLFGLSVGLIATYLLSTHWVFERRVLSRRRTEFTIFLLLTLLGLGLNEVCLWGATDLAGLHYTLAKVLATGMTFMFNFATRKLVLFR